MLEFGGDLTRMRSEKSGNAMSFINLLVGCCFNRNKWRAQIEPDKKS
jgi:hypothetical protein